MHAERLMNLYLHTGTVTRDEGRCSPRHDPRPCEQVRRVYYRGKMFGFVHLYNGQRPSTR